MYGDTQQNARFAFAIAILYALALLLMTWGEV